MSEHFDDVAPAPTDPMPDQPDPEEYQPVEADPEEYEPSQPDPDLEPLEPETLEPEEEDPAPEPERQVSDPLANPMPPQESTLTSKDVNDSPQLPPRRPVD